MEVPTVPEQLPLAEKPPNGDPNWGVLAVHGPGVSSPGGS